MDRYFDILMQKVDKMQVLINKKIYIFIDRQLDIDRQTVRY